jgi:diamine N-acetyltransferase
MNISTRYATIEDAEMIADLSRETFYDTFAAQNSAEDMDIFMNQVFTKEKLIEEVGEERHIFIIAETSDRVVGYAKLREGNNHEGLGDLPAIEISRIYSIKDVIGKGVGSTLMAECIRAAHEIGKRIIWLGVWEKNESAIRFYERWGFEKFAEHEFVLGNDIQTDWLMKKLIS